MYVGALRRYSAAVKTQYRLIWLFSLLPAAALLALVPVVFSLKNLEAYAVSLVLERFFALVGALLLVPLPLPEQDGAVREVVGARYTSQTGILLLRLLLVLPALPLLVGLLCGIMRAGGSVFPLGMYWFGGTVSALALGALGFFAYVGSQNWVAGYLAPAIWFTLCMSLRDRLGVFNLFSLAQNSLTEKYWMLGFSLLLLAAALLWHWAWRRMRGIN